MRGFDRLTGALQYQITNLLRWPSLRPVQEQTIDAVLDGDNCVVLAPTAGGKTEAAFFPLLSRMVDEDWAPVSVVYLSPIRALLNNQEPRVADLAGMVGRRAFKWHGDVGAGQRTAFVRDPADILLITPESIEAMLLTSKTPARELFAGLRAVIIDEIHAFADDDRGAHLSALLERLTRYASRDVQRIGLSATVGNPPEILRWVQGSSERAARVVDPGGARAIPELSVDYVASLENAAKVVRALHPGKKRLVFTDSRQQAEALGQRLATEGVLTYIIHGSLSLSARRDAERAFAEERDCVIVATSALELGIDVGDLDHVLQIDAPGTVSSFLQRMGRSGRRGGPPNCTFLTTREDRLLQAMAIVRLFREGFVEPVHPSARASHVLAHQILSLAIQHGGIAPDDFWPWLEGAAPFEGLTAEERGELVQHMMHEEILSDHGGRLWLGVRGEKLYGRANFRALYAVFESPRMITVQHAKHEIGTVDARFLASLEEPGSLGSFTLGGRSWQIVDIEWGRGRCTVRPAEAGKTPRWSGGARHLGYALCQTMKRILLEPDDEDPSWSARAREKLAHARAAHAFLAELPDGLVDEGAEQITWYDFAGGEANVLLARLFERELGGKVIARDTSLTFTKEAGKSLAAVRQAIEALRSAGRPRGADALRFAPDVTKSRFSKFQACLPDHLARALMVEKLVDLRGARLALGLDPEVEAAPSRAAYARPKRPIEWVRTPGELVALCLQLEAEPFVALDVETTLTDKRLCLIQLGTERASYLVDPFTVGDLGPLARVLGSARVEKVIHNAQFERSVLGALGIEIENVYDTLVESRRRYGALGAGHSLLAVSRRELDLAIDKRCQTSDWTRRPLGAEQEAYAALDVELLVDLRAAFGRAPPR